MAGKNQSQTTAAAPAPSPSASPMPAASEATGNTSSSSNPPPAPTKEKILVKKPSNAAPTPENAAPTVDRTQAELAAALAELENDEEPQDGKTGNGNGKAAKANGTSHEKPKEKEDKVDDLEDEIEATAKAAGLKTAEVAEEPEKVVAEKETDEVETPDEGTNEYEAWKKTLSKPAVKKLNQLERTKQKAMDTAAERIVVPPTKEQPLSHVRNLQQFETEERYWTHVHETLLDAKEGEPVTLTGYDGKKLTLDPEIEDEKATLDEYRTWSKNAVKALPTVRKRIDARESSKPWAAAEKLVPGVVGDKDSAANKLAVEFLTRNQSVLNDPNHEIDVAHMVRSKLMEEETKATADYPKGKFVYMFAQGKLSKLPLDKEGSIIVTKKAPAGGEPAGKRAPTNVGSKPVITTRSSNATNVDALYAIAEKSGREEDLQRALAAEERGSR